VDLTTKEFKKIPIEQQVYNTELSPKGNYIAFLACNPSAKVNGNYVFDIGIYDVAKHTSQILLRGKAARNTSLAWHPDGNSLTFHSINSMIANIDIADGSKDTVMFKGEMPAWSPDGKRIAYCLNNSEVHLYDYIRKSSKRIYKRYFWQSAIEGRLYWSPDGRYVSFNVASGIHGKSLKYIVLDVESRKSFTIYEGSYWGGPWLGAMSGK
jgi:Tol biopolymer transport system component